MKRFAFVLMLIAILCGQSIRPAYAVCTTCSCSVQPASLTFPTYVFSTGVSSSTTIGYSCSGSVGATVPVQVAISPGHGTFAQRAMTGPGTLNYQLFTLLGQVFGDGSLGTSFYNGTGVIGVTGTFSGGAPVNGTIPANQSVRSGSYGDSLTETISF